VLTFGSLFAGIGGFDLGFERAGMQCKWQVEIDDYCSCVLAKHWPEVKRYGDIRECGSHNLAPVDVIVGGFPCQPHSYAGKRKGAADDRNLWPEYLRLVKALRPRWVVGENVPGLITTMLDEVLSDLEGAEYAVGTLVVPAVAFNAPHRRARVFIVAHANVTGLAQRESQRGDTREEQQAIERSGGERRGTHVADASQLFSDGCDSDGEQFAPRTIPESGDGDSQGRSESNWWLPQRGLGRVADGISPKMDEPRFWLPEPNIPRVCKGQGGRVARLRALGNAVVPQVAQWIGHQIIAVENL